MSSKWKSQHRCHIILEILTGRQFMSVRPYWLKNPETGRNLELDCYNEEYRLALEYNGVQHYNYTPHFHSDMARYEGQIVRDHIKKILCDKNGVYLIIVPYSVGNECLVSHILMKLITTIKLGCNISLLPILD